MMWFWCVKIALLFAGCSTEPASSEAKWGHLDDNTGGNRAGWFINIMPGETVEICGSDREIYETEKAFKKWAAAIGRAEQIKVVACTDAEPSKKKWVITVSQSSWSMCTPGTGKVEMGGGGSGPTEAMLHEMGHLWGMCDQYTDNCDPENRGEWNLGSVMGSAASLELKEDDIVGIKKLAQREGPDFPANAVWTKLIQQQTEVTH